MQNQGETLAIGVVGLGYWGPNWVRNILQNSKYRLSWVVDQNPERLQTIKRIYGLNDSQVFLTLPDALNSRIPNLALLATPPSLHLEFGKMVLSSGSNLIIEKPIGLNSDQTTELLNFGKLNNKKIYVDHTYIFTPVANKIRNLIETNELGELQFVISSRLNLGLIQRDVDVIRDLAVHDVALFDYFFKKQPINVSANVSTHSPANIPSTANLDFNYAKGLIAQVSVSWNSPVKVRSMIISGSKKSILWDDTNQSEKLKIYEASADLELTETNRFISYSLGDTLIPKVSNTEAIHLQLDHIFNAENGQCEAINSYEHIERVNDVLRGFEKSVESQGIRTAI